MVALNNLGKFSVLLLSAGRGSRLGKKGKIIPKSLLKIGSETILFRITNYLMARGLKEVNIVVGYKYKKILNELKKFKDLKVNYIKIKDYVNNGSSFSWFKFHKLWNKKKKPLLVMHTDIVFDEKHFDNILKSKKLNIIGVKKEKKNKLKKNSFVVQVNKKMEIEKIGLNHQILKSYGEITCINKFSTKSADKIFKFMNDYFKINGSDMTWEYILSDFIQFNYNEKFFILKNQIFNWVNVNTPKDIILAKKLFGEKI